MGNVVSLNRFRKKEQREERANPVEINRLRHGRTRAQTRQKALQGEPRMRFPRRAACQRPPSSISS
ncbi:MAG: DUF4169 family protein [Myxococcales bacterium]|nr:DUF4169 family protein [Myxococcales bacterium]